MVRPHGLSQPEGIGVGLEDMGFGHGFISQLVVNAAPGDRAVTRVLNVDGTLRHAVDQAEPCFQAGLFQGFRALGIVADRVVQPVRMLQVFRLHINFHEVESGVFDGLQEGGIKRSGSSGAVTGEDFPFGGTDQTAGSLVIQMVPGVDAVPEAVIAVPQAHPFQFGAFVFHQGLPAPGESVLPGLETDQLKPFLGLESVVHQHPPDGDGGCLQFFGRFFKQLGGNVLFILFPAAPAEVLERFRINFLFPGQGSALDEREGKGLVPYGGTGAVNILVRGGDGQDGLRFGGGSSQRTGFHKECSVPFKFQPREGIRGGDGEHGHEIAVFEVEQGEHGMVPRFGGAGIRSAVQQVAGGCPSEPGKNPVPVSGPAAAIR